MAGSEKSGVFYLGAGGAPVPKNGPLPPVSKETGSSTENIWPTASEP